MEAKRLIVNTNDNDSEYISYLLHEAGSLGEQIMSYADIQNVLDDKSRWDYAEQALFTKTDEVKVIAYFDISTPDKEIYDIMKAIKDESFGELSKVTFSVDLCVTEDDGWKRDFTPIEIGKLVVLPEWLEFETDKTIVKINPGLGFGTGYHETTSMCLDMLQSINLQDKKVFDFGCGSGILGIASIRLGASDCKFIDNDEQAIESTIDNCALNQINDPNTVLLDVNKGFDECADIVVANICADVLINVVNVMKSAVKSGGVLILSGIIESRANDVLSAYKDGFELKLTKTLSGWCAYMFERKD